MRHRQCGRAWGIEPSSNSRFPLPKMIGVNQQLYLVDQVLAEQDMDQFS